MEIFSSAINDYELHTRGMAAEEAAHQQEMEHQQRLHEEQMEITREQFREKEEQKRKFHLTSLGVSIDIARRDAIRDAVTYKNATAQIVMAVDAVLLGSIFAVIYQFEPAESSSDAWLVIVSFLVAGSVFFLLLSVGFGIVFHTKITGYSSNNILFVYSPCGKTHSTFNDYFYCHCLWAEKGAVRSLFTGLGATVLAAGCYQYLVMYDITLNPYITPRPRPSSAVEVLLQKDKSIVHVLGKNQTVTSAAAESNLTIPTMCTAKSTHCQFSLLNVTTSREKIAGAPLERVFNKLGTEALNALRGVKQDSAQTNTREHNNTRRLKIQKQFKENRRGSKAREVRSGARNAEGHNNPLVSNSSSSSSSASHVAHVGFVALGKEPRATDDEGGESVVIEDGEVPSGQGPGALFLAFCVLTAVWVLLSRWLVVGRTRAGNQDLIGFDDTGETLQKRAEDMARRQKGQKNVDEDIEDRRGSGLGNETTKRTPRPADEIATFRAQQARRETSKR